MEFLTSSRRSEPSGLDAQQLVADCSEQAQDFILAHMAGQVEFPFRIRRHISRDTTAPAPETAKTELLELLTKAGIAPETGLKSFAA